MEDHASRTPLLSGEDLVALKIDLQAIARQQSLQIDIFIEMSKLIAHMVQTQREQIALLEARGIGGA